MNTKVGSQQRFEMALSAKQIGAVVVIALAALGGAFLLGASAERGAAPHAAATPSDALARLDEPVTGHDEAPLELRAHEALTDKRAIDKTLPVPAVRPQALVATAPAEDDDVLAPPPVAAPAAAEAPPRAAPAIPAVQTSPAAPSPAMAVAPPASDPVELALPDEPAPQRPARKEPAREAARARGRFTIQVGAVPHRQDAERLAKRFSSKNPHIVPADVPGRGRWYRVQIGSFETQDSARRQLAALSASGVQGIVTAAR
jgi:cell division protein FtsN